MNNDAQTLELSKKHALALQSAFSEIGSFSDCPHCETAIRLIAINLFQSQANHCARLGIDFVVPSAKEIEEMLEVSSFLYQTLRNIIDNHQTRH